MAHRERGDRDGQRGRDGCGGGAERGRVRRARRGSRCRAACSSSRAASSRRASPAARRARARTAPPSAEQHRRGPAPAAGCAAALRRAPGHPTERAARAPPSASSPPSAAMPSSTSTSESAQAATVSKPSLNSVKIATVNVWYCTISNAPYSASRPSVTSRQPPSTAGRIWRSVTRRKVCHGPRPRLRAASSRLASALASAVRAGQVDERVQRQRHDHHRRPVAVQAGIERDPAEADDEVGDAERQHEQHRPQPPRGQRGALDAPGGGDAEHGAQQRCTRASGAACSTAAPRRSGAAADARTSPQPDCWACTTRKASGSSTSAAASRRRRR